MPNKISAHVCNTWFLALGDSDLEKVELLHSLYPGLLNKKLTASNYTALYVSTMFINDEIEIFDYIIKQEKLNVNQICYDGKTVLEYMTYQLSFMGKKTEHVINKLITHPKIIINKDFFHRINKKSFKYFKKYTLQKTIIDNNIENYRAFIESDNSKYLIHPKIRIEYPQLFTGMELGLL